VLSRAQRRALVQQVRGRRPVDPVRLRLARDVAARQVRQQGLPWLLAGLLLDQVGLAIGDPSSFRMGYAVGFAVFYGGVLLLLRRQRDQMRRFLAAHPA